MEVYQEDLLNDQTFQPAFRDSLDNTFEHHQPVVDNSQTNEVLDQHSIHNTSQEIDQNSSELHRKEEGEDHDQSSQVINDQNEIHQASLNNQSHATLENDDTANKDEKSKMSQSSNNNDREDLQDNASQHQLDEERQQIVSRNSSHKSVTSKRNEQNHSVDNQRKDSISNENFQSRHSFNEEKEKQPDEQSFRKDSLEEDQNNYLESGQNEKLTIDDDYKSISQHASSSHKKDVLGDLSNISVQKQSRFADNELFRDQDPNTIRLDSLLDQRGQSNNSMRRDVLERSQQSLQPSITNAQIEERQKKKQELERQLKELETEMQIINNKDDNPDADGGLGDSPKKQPKTKLSVKHNEIATDKTAKENAVVLVRRMNQARKERELKQQREREEFSEKLIAEARESHQRQLEMKQQQDQQKRERIMSKIEQVRVRSEERRVINKQSNLIIKEIKNEVTHNDPQEKFKQEVELPELERRKRELAEKRKLFKPIEFSEIREHAKRHDDEIRTRKLQARANVPSYSDQAIDAIENMQRFPKSQTMNKVIEEDKLAKVKDILEMQKKKEQIERRKEYAKLVKEVHIPKVRTPVPFEITTTSTANEMLESSTASKEQRNRSKPRIRSLQPENRRTIVSDSKSPSRDIISKIAASSNHGARSHHQLHADQPQQEEEEEGERGGTGHPPPRSLGKYNKTTGLMIQKTNDFYNPKMYVRNQNRSSSGNNKNSSSSNQFDGADENYDDENVMDGTNKEDKLSEITTIKDKKKQTLTKKSTIPVDIPKPPVKKQNDYIQELRRQREDQEKKQGKKVKQDDWEKYKYDPTLSNNEKYSCILQTATRLEHQAKLKEMRNMNDPDLQDQANLMYIDSIKAKLALLDNLN